MSEALRIAGYGLSALLAVLAVLVARRNRAHWPFAAWAIWMPATDWIRVGLRAVRASTPDPKAGLGLVMHHLGEGLVLSWSFTFLALTLVAFTRVRPWPTIIGWAIPMALCLDHATFHHENLEALYRVTGITCMGLGLLAIAWALLVRRDLQPQLHHLAIMVFAAGDVMLYLSPFIGSFFTDWDVARSINAVCLSVGCTMHVLELRRQARPGLARMT